MLCSSHSVALSMRSHLQALPSFPSGQPSTPHSAQLPKQDETAHQVIHGNHAHALHTPHQCTKSLPAWQHTCRTKPLPQLLFLLTCWHTRAQTLTVLALMHRRMPQHVDNAANQATALHAPSCTRVCTTAVPCPLQGQTGTSSPSSRHSPQGRGAGDTTSRGTPPTARAALQTPGQRPAAARTRHCC